MAISRLIAAASTLIAFGAVPADAASLIALGADQKNVYEIDTSTGAASLLLSLPDNGPGLGYDGLAWDGTSLFVGDNGSAGNYLARLDLGTGTVTRFATPTGVGSLVSLAYDSVSDVLYGITQDFDRYSLRTFDRATGVATFVGGTPFINTGMTYDPTNDILWGSNFDFGSIYTLNQTGDTNAGTSLPPTGLGAFPSPVYPSGLAWNDATATLYTTNGRSLYTVDTTTGLASLIGPTIGSSDRIGSLEFMPDAVVPLPASGVLLLTALAAIFGRGSHGWLSTFIGFLRRRGFVAQPA